MAATLQRKCSCGMIFEIITKIIARIIVPRNSFVITSARMVVRLKDTPAKGLEKGVGQGLGFKGSVRGGGLEQVCGLLVLL